MDAHPLVSVIVPVYNTKKYLRECFEGLFGQTYSPIEIIACDDHSTDGSCRILEDYSSQGKIRLLKNSKNLRLSLTRNKLLEASGGELVAFMDSDDIPRPDRIEHQVRFFSQNPHVHILGGDVEILRGGQHLPNSHTFLFESDQKIKALLSYAMAMNSPTIMVRKNVALALPFRPHFSAAEDLDWLLRAKDQNYQMANLKRVLCSYRIHDQATGSRNRKKQILNVYYAYKLHRERKRWKKEITDLEKIDINRPHSLCDRVFLASSNIRREDSHVTRLLRLASAPFSPVGRDCLLRSIKKHLYIQMT